jgi:adenylate kinase
MLPEEFAVDTERSRATPAPSAGATTTLVKVIRNDMRKHEAAKELLEVIRSPMEGKN